MKKLISISLVLVLAGGLLLAGNTKAEALNNESAALLTASLVELQRSPHRDQVRLIIWQSFKRRDQPIDVWEQTLDIFFRP